MNAVRRAGVSGVKIAPGFEGEQTKRVSSRVRIRRGGQGQEAPCTQPQSGIRSEFAAKLRIEPFQSAEKVQSLVREETTNRLETNKTET
jgi:hypothetical protein